MTYTATFDDWLALLGVRAEFVETFEGERRIGTALDDLTAARTTWPGVDQDYIEVLEQASAVLLDLRETVAEQAEWLEKLRDEVTLVNAAQEYVYVNAPPADPIDRLLNQAELDEVQRVLDEIDEAIGAVENAPDDQEEDTYGDGWGDEG